MNNNKFNNKIELPEYLCERTKTAVELAVAKHNQAYRKRRTVLLSTAACFAVFAISIVSVKYFNQNQLAPSENTTIHGATNVNTDNTANTPTKNDAVIYLENNDDKHPPQSFALNGKIYLQYSLGKSYEDTKIKINQSDIGEAVCELGSENLAEYSPDYEQWSDSIFNKAKVYKYTKAKSDSILIVQTTDGKYYLFSIDYLPGNYNLSDLLNAYAANGTNEIIGIEIWQNVIIDFPDEYTDYGPLGIGGKESRPILKGTIKDKDTIQTVLSILEKSHDKFNDDDAVENDLVIIHENHKLMSDYGMYDLRIVFSDGQQLELPARDTDYTSRHAPGVLFRDPSALDIHLRKGYFCIDVGGKAYSISDSDYNELAAILEENISN